MNNEQHQRELLRAATWRKSRASGEAGCAEVANLSDGTYALHHSKHPDDGVLIFTPVEWQAFVDGIAAGDFDA